MYCMYYFTFRFKPYRVIAKSEEEAFMIVEDKISDDIEIIGCECTGQVYIGED